MTWNSIVLAPRFTFRLAILCSVVFVGLGCLAALPTLADGVNIVSDPSFESGTAGSYTGAMGDGWVVTAGTGAICNSITFAGCGNVGNANTGSQMAFLDWSNSSNTITQDLTTVIGQTYTISYWVADGQPNLLEVMFGGSMLFDGTAPANGTLSGAYVEYTFNATATSTSTVLAFSGQRTTGRGGTLLDDVSVTAVPEPATGLLTSVALLGLVVLRWRHSKISPKAGGPFDRNHQEMNE